MKWSKVFFWSSKIVLNGGIATCIWQRCVCVCVWIICFISSEVLIQKQKYKNIAWYFHSYWKHRESQRLPCESSICTHLCEIFPQNVYFVEHLNSIRIHQMCYRNQFTLRFLHLGLCHTLIQMKANEYTFIVTCGPSCLVFTANCDAFPRRNRKTKRHLKFLIVIGETKKKKKSMKQLENSKLHIQQR